MYGELLVRRWSVLQVLEGALAETNDLLAGGVTELFLTLIDDVDCVVGPQVEDDFLTLSACFQVHIEEDGLSNRFRTLDELACDLGLLGWGGALAHCFAAALLTRGVLSTTASERAWFCCRCNFLDFMTIGHEVVNP